MNTFSKRNNITYEYSGYQTASKELRYRLLLVIKKYTYPSTQLVNRYDKRISEMTVNVALSTRFGTEFNFTEIEDPSVPYNQVFDTVEIFINVIKNQTKLYKPSIFSVIVELFAAFKLSNSVYSLDKKQQVVLKLEEKTVKLIEEVTSILSPYENAVTLFTNSISGLVSRKKEPRDIIKDLFITFEEYCKKITGTKKYDLAWKKIKSEVLTHPLQGQIIEKLEAYRGDSKNVAHSTDSIEPDTVEALWFMETLITQIKYIDSKINSQ